MLTYGVLIQALAYQWLGRWYEDIDQDYKQAQHCYERAVTLDEDDIIAGMHAITCMPLSCLQPACMTWHTSTGTSTDLICILSRTNITTKLCFCKYRIDMSNLIHACSL